jgi:hypothetical protein
MEKSVLINKIVELEWLFFQSTQNAGGRADCQDDRTTFEIMRSSQAKVWSEAALESYLNDLDTAMAEGQNPVAYKYAYMMEQTFPDEYERIKNMLPPVSPYKLSLVDKICDYYGQWTFEAYTKYPKLTSRGRPITTKAAGSGRWAAVDNYFRSELLTYSERTLLLCLSDTEAAFKRSENLVIAILENTAKAYGYDSIEDAESKL